MKRLALWLAAEILAISLLQRELGLDTPHLVMLLTCVVALTIVTLTRRPDPAAGPTSHPPWPPDRRDRRSGARDEVASLAWTFFGRDDVISAQGLRTIKAVAATRLHAHGADLADPDDAGRCRELLGDEAYRLLDPTAPTTAPRPTVAQLGRLLTTLESLAPRTTP